MVDAMIIISKALFDSSSLDFFFFFHFHFGVGVEL